MRNFKKILSLVLAMAMALSLAVTAGAAFKDEADFSADYVTAAEVLTNLGVLKGYEDGSFQPKASITRAETAALIYRAVTADVDDTQKGIYTAMTNGFDDVKNADWFAGYVNFCANAKFIAGYGDGKFGPNDKVTGYQTLAMILRAVGYDHNREFIGAGWELKTAAIAQEIGMLENVSAEQLGAPATRELVAELIFQAMTCAPTVHWNDIFKTYRFDETTLGYESFELAQVEGVVWANEEANLGTGDSLKAGETQIFTNKVSAPYDLSTGLDIIGEQVTFWAVEDETAVSTPISKATTSTKWSDTTYNFLSKADKDAFAEDVDKHTVYDNYDLDADKVVNMGKGIYVKVIDNPDAADYVMTETLSLSAVQYIDNDGDVKLDCQRTEIDVDKAVYEGIAKDDVVLYAEIDGKTFIQKASYITGIVTGADWPADADYTATIGGEKYAESDIIVCENTESDDFVLTRNEVSTYRHDYNNKTYNYFQDAYGNIVAYAFADETDFGYAMILRYDMVCKDNAWVKDTLWVEYLTADGEVKDAVVDEDEGLGSLALEKKAPGDVVNYRIDADGEFVVVYPCDDVDNTKMTVDAEDELATITTAEYKHTHKYPFIEKVETEKLYNADEIVAFYYYYDAVCKDFIYGVKTGADALADLDGRTVELSQVDLEAATTADLIGDALMVNISDTYAPATQYAYITAEKCGMQTIDGSTYFTYPALSDEGEKIEIVTKQDVTLKAGTIVEYFEYDVNVVGEEEVQEFNFFVIEREVEKGYIFTYSNSDIGMFFMNGRAVEQPEFFVDVENETTFEYSQLDGVDSAYAAAVINNDNEALAVFVIEGPDGRLPW